MSDESTRRQRLERHPAIAMVEDDGDNVGDNDVKWTHSFCNVCRLRRLKLHATFEDDSDRRQ